MTHATRCHDTDIEDWVNLSQILLYYFTLELKGSPRIGKENGWAVEASRPWYLLSLKHLRSSHRSTIEVDPPLYHTLDAQLTQNLKPQPHMQLDQLHNLHNLHANCCTSHSGGPPLNPCFSTCKSHSPIPQHLHPLIPHLQEPSVTLDFLCCAITLLSRV